MLCFSGPYITAFSPNKRKYGPEKTQYLDTFYAEFMINLPDILLKTNHRKGRRIS